MGNGVFREGSPGESGRMSEPNFIERPPTVAELRRLAESVGWSDHFDWGTVGRALEGSLHAVVVLEDDLVVGTARVVGDGVRYFSIHDVIVRPDESGQGLASRLVELLLDWVRAQAPAGAVVGLFASPDAVGIYESLGFTAADADPLGMTLDIPPAP